MDPEIKKVACDLIGKAYEHHKNHARFEETQRAWMVAAYFTFTGLIYAGVFFSKIPPESGGPFPRFWIVALVAHFIVGTLIMISVAKVSGEFRRHFDQGEYILSDIKTVCESDESLKTAFQSVLLQTAAHEEKSCIKRIMIRLLSNTAVHNYMFAFLTSLDVYLVLPEVLPKMPPVAAAFVWFVGVSALLYKYVDSVIKAR